MMNDPSGLRVLTTTGLRVVTGLTAAEASQVGRHWNAIRRYLETGDDTRLTGLTGVVVGATHPPGPGVGTAGGFELETDLDVIEWHAVRGDIGFESIYDEVI